MKIHEHEWKWMETRRRNWELNVDRAEFCWRGKQGKLLLEHFSTIFVSNSETDLRFHVNLCDMLCDLNDTSLVAIDSGSRKPFHSKTIWFWSCPLESTYFEVVHRGWIWMAMDNLWIRSRDFKVYQNLHFPTDSPDRIRDRHLRTSIQASAHLVSVSFLEQFHQSILL